MFIVVTLLSDEDDHDYNVGDDGSTWQLQDDNDYYVN